MRFERTNEVWQEFLSAADVLAEWVLTSREKEAFQKWREQHVKLMSRARGLAQKKGQGL